MCLNIKNGQEPEVATEDIICYKLIYVDPYNDKLKTFYMNKTIHLGKTYRSTLVRTLCKFTHIVETGLHSIVTIDEAYRVLPKDSSINRISFLVKCIIPKGSKYYVGTFDTCFHFGKNIKSYASNKIIYTEEIIDSWAFQKPVNSHLCV